MFESINLKEESLSDKQAYRRNSNFFLDIATHRSKLVAAVFFGWLLLWCQPSYSQELDSEIDTDSEAVAPKDSAKAGKGNKRVRVSGFMQQFFLKQFDTNHDGEAAADRFRVQRVRLKFSGKVEKNIGYQIEIDPRAPEITGFLRDAYISLYHIPRHEIRFGQQKTQFGYENNVSSSRLYFVNRTDVSDNLSRGINLRDIGVGLLGNFPFSKTFRIEHATTLVNGSGLNVQKDETKKKNIWGRAGVRYKTDDLMWRFGVSGGYGDILEAEAAPDSSDLLINFKRLGTDFELEHKWFTAVAEYVQGWNNDPFEGGETVSGFYGYLTGKTPWQAGPLLRYENELADGFTRWIIGAYYGMPSAKFRVLLNYEFRKSEEDTEDNRLYLWCQVRF